MKKIFNALTFMTSITLAFGYSPTASASSTGELLKKYGLCSEFASLAGIAAGGVGSNVILENNALTIGNRSVSTIGAAIARKKDGTYLDLWAHSNQVPDTFLSHSEAVAKYGEETVIAADNYFYRVFPYALGIGLPVAAGIVAICHEMDNRAANNSGIVDSKKIADVAGESPVVKAAAVAPATH